MLNFLKNWTLPVAMLAGALGYFIFANFAFLEPTKPFMSSFISYLTPALIFAQLLLTFCKVQKVLIFTARGKKTCLKPFMPQSAVA